MMESYTGELVMLFEMEAWCNDGLVRGMAGKT